MNVAVNQSAPVRSSTEIQIGTPAASVWEVLTRIDEWPAWQGDVTQAQLTGPLCEGAEFRWKAGGIPFRSKLHTVVPNREIGWTGKTLGTSAIHNWWLQESEGKTVVRVEESLQGFLPALFRSSFQKSLDAGMQKNLRELKAAVEAGSVGG